VNRRLEERAQNPETGPLPIRLHAFVEEQPVDFIGCVSCRPRSNGNNDMLTWNQRVVEPSSAKIPGHNSDTIPANHMEMTKFRTGSDVGYKRILNRLRIWVRNNPAGGTAPLI
jgi:hypothetical protein